MCRRSHWLLSHVSQAPNRFGQAACRGLSHLNSHQGLQQLARASERYPDCDSPRLRCGRNPHAVMKGPVAPREGNRLVLHVGQAPERRVRRMRAFPRPWHTLCCFPCACHNVPHGEQPVCLFSTEVEPHRLGSDPGRFLHHEGFPSAHAPVDYSFTFSTHDFWMGVTPHFSPVQHLLAPFSPTRFLVVVPFPALLTCFSAIFPALLAVSKPCANSGRAPEITIHILFLPKYVILYQNV